jgi:uncharacterized DUF497 family protein
VKITWDPAKAKSNRLKHQVWFPDVEAVFYDPMAITIDDISSQGEARLVSIGKDSVDRTMVVVYTYRDDCIRLISARKANRNERQAYEKAIRF